MKYNVTKLFQINSQQPILKKRQSLGRNRNCQKTRTVNIFCIRFHLLSSNLGLDTKSEPCQRFFREGLTMSFQKILNDDAVHSWKYEIQVQCKGSTQ